MNLDLTQPARETLHKIERVTRTVIAPAAEACDRENRFPRESFGALRAEGLLAMVLHHVANARLAIETMTLWLRHAATLWENRHIADAEVASNSCRYLAEQHALSVLDHAVRACGAGSLLKPHPLERILRDLQTYVRHENSDALLATIGRATVGLEYDPNFSRQLKDR